MTLLYYCPSMTGLAEQIADAHPQIALGRIEWACFGDGYPNIRVRDALDSRNRDIAFLAAFDTPGDIFTQLSVIYEIPRFGVKSFRVILPFFPTGTMERVEEEGDIATASTLARMLSGIPLSVSGPTQVVIFDIHALQERFYFSDTVIPRLETAIPLVQERIRATENLSIAFPDEGAQKRFGKLFAGYDQILCHKIRQNDHRTVTVKEGNPKGRHVVIIDDLVMTGGTLLECRKALKEKGATDVSAYVTHGVFPRDSWKRFTDAGFHRFWLTDSCPKTAETIRDCNPFEVLSLKDLIADILTFRLNAVS